jgi:methyl-accepting chemotaxis protein
MHAPPSTAADPALTARLRGLARLAAGMVMLIPCAVFTGWIFDIDVLKRVAPGLVAMNPLTALSFLAAGCGLCAATGSGKATRVPALCGLGIATVGAVILCRYLFGWDAGIDRLLFARSLGDNVIAPTAAFNFLLSGLALALLDWETPRGVRPSSALAVAVALLALLVLTGYCYGVEKLYRLRDFIAMAVHTAFAFLLLATALLCARADRGLMARLTSDRAGGAMLRRLLFAQVSVPFALGYLILWGHRAGYFEPALGFSLFVVGVIAFIAVLTWRNAALLDCEDAERSHAEEELRETHAGLESTVQQRTVELTQAVAGIREGLGVLGVSSSGVLESSSGLAASANETAASVTETTTAVDEVRQTAQLASERARRVAEAARRTAEVSATGTRATQGTVAGMERIRVEMQSIAASMMQLSEQSHAIGEIIAAVDDLAEQSNLLAVNAAIEAAHAGAQGKGFAVVADQVKYLATQSRAATKQVRTILTDIQKATTAAALTTEQATKAVEAGVSTASEAGGSIVSLASHVSDAAQTATQIAASSQEQLLGLEHIALAMGQIGTASRQNVDQAKQLETAARSLNALGQRLKELVERHQTSAP